MALTPTEEAQTRLLIAQEAELLSLASNEPTIISKLGATKVTLSDLTAAGSAADADLFLTRQSTTDKSITAATLAAYMQAKNSSAFVLKAGDTMTGPLALAGNSTAVTAAQFDSDTSIATTEFVQRAIGNFPEITAINTTQTLTAAHSGQLIGIATGGITVTLPSRSGLRNGVTFSFVNSNGATSGTLLPPSGDTFVSAFGSTKSSLILGPGDTVSVTVFGSTWLISGGSIQMGVPGSASFGNSLANNGYQKLPSGLIIQMGRVTTSGSADVAVTFPIAFPNACFDITFGNVSMNAFGAVGSNGQPTTTGFNIAGYSGSGRAIINANWIAFGN